MKKHTYLLIVILACLVLNIWPTVVTIGTGTATQRYPLGCFFGYERSASTFLATEVTTTGEITGIALYSTVAQTTTVPVKIYLKTWGTTYFVTSGYWADFVNGAQLVYDGTFANLPAGGWYQFNFSQPFFYFGGQNLLVMIETSYGDVNGGVGTGASTGAGVRYSTNTSRRFQAWLGNGSPSTGAGAVLNNRPNIQITLQPPSPMTFTSCTTTQISSPVVINSTDEPVIGIQVNTLGMATPLSLTQLTVNAHGTTNVSDISNAKVYYTGTSSTFSTTTQFGSTEPNPTITNFDITGSQTLAQGTNYFWLTYDIPPTATNNNLVDAECTSLTVAGVAHTPTTTAPAGNRLIRGPLSGILTIGPGGNYTSFTGAINDLNVLGVGPGGVTFSVTSGIDFVEDPPAITMTGTESNPILFQKSGSANAALRPSGTAGASDAGFYLIGGDYITFDGIDVIINSGSALEYGYFLNGTVTDGACYNTIKNCTITLNSANQSSIGIYTIASATATNTNNYNHFYNLAISNAGCGIRLNGGGNYWEDTGNEIGILPGGTTTITNISTSSALTSGIYASYQVSCNIFSTTINNVTSGSSWSVGIWTDGNTSIVEETNINVYSNEISGVTGYNNTYGIYMATGVSDIHHNDVHDINSTHANAYGMQTIGAFNIYDNKIHHINSTIANTVYAFLLEGGLTNNVYNNVVYDLSAPNSTASPSVMVFNIIMGYYMNIYNNSVSLTATTNLANSNTGIFSWISNPHLIDIRNNVLCNNSDVGSGGSGIAAIYWGTGLGNEATTTDNNLYYAGTPGPQHVIYYGGTTNYSTLGEYQAFVNPRDASAWNENPPFVNPLSDLHVQTGMDTSINDNAQPITSPFAIITDFDGNPRSATNPDLGAFEGVFGLSIPLAATNPVPADQAIDVAVDTSLSWDTVTDATSYDIYFGITLPASPNANVTSPTWTPALLDYSTEYQWKVVPRNLTGVAINCPVWSFTTIIGQSLNPPLNVRISRNGSNVELDWDAVSGANSYNVYCALSPYTPIESWTLLSSIPTNTCMDYDTSSFGKFYKVTALTTAR